MSVNKASTICAVFGSTQYLNVEPAMS